MGSAATVEPHLTNERYFALADAGVLGPNDRVELLEGVIVSMSPQTPRHASTSMLVHDALRAIVGPNVVLRVQLPFIASGASVPEPDVAVVPGEQRDYLEAHPTTALLIVEVADSSLLADRLTKAAIYAAAGVPEYWIVNLRDSVVEVHRQPDRPARRYAERIVASPGERIDLAAFAAASVAVADLIPAID